MFNFHVRIIISGQGFISTPVDDIRKVGTELPLLSVAQSSAVMIGIVTDKEDIIIIIIIIIMFLLTLVLLKQTVIPIAQAPSFRPQYFTYYV